MAVVLYGIPNCDTVKKARTWLAANAVQYTFHDFKKVDVSADMLKAWLATTEWEILVNRKGTTWRGLSEERKASVTDAQSAATLMQEFPSVIKRPVLSVDRKIHVGFSPDNYQQIFKS
ncbi:MAG: ArsC family reductase [Burkholderiaceae bacterium]